MPNPVVLSNDQEYDVETLGIFELDQFPLPGLGDFTYEMEMVTGDKKEVKLDLSRYETLPAMPGIPEHEAVEGSPIWYKWREWQLVQAALLHDLRRLEEADEYSETVLGYVKEKLSEHGDLNQIKTLDDWRRLVVQAVVPPLTRRILADTLRTTYNARYANKEIFDAMDKASGGRSSYNAIRLWENQLANLLRLNDWEYAQLPLLERSRRVCALKIADWLEYLETDRSKRERALQAAMSKGK